jgi:hypothetical protein
MMIAWVMEIVEGTFISAGQYTSIHRDIHRDVHQYGAISLFKYIKYSNHE